MDLRFLAAAAVAGNSRASTASMAAVPAVVLARSGIGPASASAAMYHHMSHVASMHGPANMAPMHEHPSSSVMMVAAPVAVSGQHHGGVAAPAAGHEIGVHGAVPVPLPVVSAGGVDGGPPSHGLETFGASPPVLAPAVVAPSSASVPAAVATLPADDVGVEHFEGVRLVGPPLSGGQPTTLAQSFGAGSQRSDSTALGTDHAMETVKTETLVAAKRTLMLVPDPTACHATFVEHSKSLKAVDRRTSRAWLRKEEQARKKCREQFSMLEAELPSADTDGPPPAKRSRVSKEQVQLDSTLRKCAEGVRAWVKQIDKLPSADRMFVMKEFLKGFHDDAKADMLKAAAESVAAGRQYNSVRSRRAKLRRLNGALDVLTSLSGASADLVHTVSMRSDDVRAGWRKSGAFRPHAEIAPTDRPGLREHLSESEVEPASPVTHVAAASAALDELDPTRDPSRAWDAEAAHMGVGHSADGSRGVVDDVMPSSIHYSLRASHGPFGIPQLSTSVSHLVGSGGFAAPASTSTVPAPHSVPALPLSAVREPHWRRSGNAERQVFGISESSTGQRLCPAMLSFVTDLISVAGFQPYAIAASQRASNVGPASSAGRRSNNVREFNNVQGRAIYEAFLRIPGSKQVKRSTISDLARAALFIDPTGAPTEKVSIMLSTLRKDARVEAKSRGVSYEEVLAGWRSLAGVEPWPDGADADIQPM